MPQRTREHELEDESRVAFESALGSSSWVYRQKPSDYGIDGEAEYFANGHTTGLRLDVQLKATDQPLERALKASISWDHVHYYRLLPQPVLMVRYHAPTRTLYAKWMHRYDSVRDGGGSKNATFRWRREDTLTPERLAALAPEVRAFLSLSSSSPGFPLACYASSDTPVVSAAQLIGRLSQLAAIRARLSPRLGTAPPASLVIHVTEDELGVDLCGVTDATLHYHSGADADRGRATVLQDSLVLIALCLSSVAQAEAAGRIGHVALAQSSPATDVAVAQVLAGEMSRARMISEMLDLATQLSALEAGQSCARTFLFGTLIHGPTLSPNEMTALRETAHALAVSPGGRAADLFNVAAIERGCGDYDQADRLLDQAATLDPAYQERPQWWIAKGMIAHERFSVDEATAAYSRAAQIAPDSLVAKYLLTEYLAWQGNYVSAIGAMPDFRDLADDAPYVSQLRLLDVFLHVIVDGYCIDRQQRDPSVNAELADVCQRELERDRILDEQTLADFLHRDALDPLTWWLLSSAELPCPPAVSFQRSLGAAWTARINAKLWEEAIIGALKAGLDGLARDLAVAGDLFTQGALLPQLAETFAESESLTNLVLDLQSLVHTIRRATDGTMEIRSIPSGTTYLVDRGM